MFIFKTKADLQHHLSQISTAIGFIPTMGALHIGHLSLVEASKTKHLYTVVSIYVNPTQFNNQEDLKNYPNTIETDLILLAQNGCDVLFLPDTVEMYGNETKSQTYHYGELTNSFEGAKRPGHFDGVITIVSKLFDAVKPNEVFFGQKDLQQCLVVKRLIDEQYPSLIFNMVPTVREPNGLAFSSRNMRLQKPQHELAAQLYKTLSFCSNNINQFSTIELLLQHAQLQFLNNPLLKCEYLALVNIQTMEKLEIYSPEIKCAFIIACWCAEVRLIDNLVLNV